MNPLRNDPFLFTLVGLCIYEVGEKQNKVLNGYNVTLFLLSLTTNQKMSKEGPKSHSRGLQRLVQIETEHSGNISSINPMPLAPDPT